MIILGRILFIEEFVVLIPLQYHAEAYFRQKYYSVSSAFNKSRILLFLFITTICCFLIKFAITGKCKYFKVHNHEYTTYSFKYTTQFYSGC
jgi:hypothetical protein